MKKFFIVWKLEWSTKSNKRKEKAMLSLSLVVLINGILMWIAGKVSVKGDSWELFAIPFLVQIVILIFVSIGVIIKQVKEEEKCQ